MMGTVARLLRQRGSNADVREEIESRIALWADPNRRSGMPADEELRAAKRQYGVATAIRERLDDLYGFGWAEALARDVGTPSAAWAGTRRSR